MSSIFVIVIVLVQNHEGVDVRDSIRVGRVRGTFFFSCAKRFILLFCSDRCCGKN